MAVKHKSHQPRLRVVAWVVLMVLKPIRQADFPARPLWPLIRIARIVMAPEMPD
jgi:hypothetical protein